MLKHFFQDDTYDASGDDDDGIHADYGGDDDYYGRVDKREARFAALSGFQEVHREWLTSGSVTPLSTIIRWMTYGRGYREKDVVLPCLAWGIDSKTLQFEGEEITVSRFQQMAQKLAADTEGCIDKLMGGKWSEVRKSIRLCGIADNLVYEGPGRSFATNRKTRGSRREPVA